MNTQPSTGLDATTMAEELLAQRDRCKLSEAETLELPVLPVLGYWSQDVDPNHHLGPEADMELLEALYASSTDFLEYMGTSHCRVCGRDGLGSADLTNGWCVYPSGLAHYIAEHGLVLPPPVRELLLKPARPLPCGPSPSWLRSDSSCTEPDHTGSCTAQHFSLALWREAMTS